MTYRPDFRGEPECELCGRRYVVSSLARDCERKDLSDPPDILAETETPAPLAGGRGRGRPGERPT